MKRITILILCILIPVLSASAISASEILAKIDTVMNAPKDQDIESKIILRDKKGDTKERTIQMLQKGSDRRLARFTSPADQKGISVLSLPGGEVYLYLPAYKKVKRIASHVKNTSFAGTDFSYSDMEARNYGTDHTGKILAEDGSTYTVETVPKNSKDYEYAKAVMKVSKESFMPITIEYFNAKGSVYKRLESRKIERAGSYWTAGEREMTNLASGHSTLIINTSVKFDTGIKDDIFTTRSLER